MLTDEEVAKIRKRDRALVGRTVVVSGEATDIMCEAVMDRRALLSDRAEMQAALAAAKEEVERLRKTMQRWCGVCPVEKCTAPECEFCDGSNTAALEGGEG